MTIARVFPTRTRMTPTDDLAFINCAPSQGIQAVDAVHVSVAFSWDVPRAEQLAEAWRVLGVPVHMGGPAFNLPGGEFEPGLYVKEGATITSRGCPNHCHVDRVDGTKLYYCAVPKREKGLRELTIKDGWNVLDDNLLACSDEHVHAVFRMLSQQPRRPEFTGGLEAKLLRPWHADALRKLKPNRMYFAYDTADDLEPLVYAGSMLKHVGFSPFGHRLVCYVLCGYQGDSFEAAERRMVQTIKAGFMPFAMLYRDETGQRDQAWMRFQREWVRPQIVGHKMRDILRPRDGRLEAII